MSHRPAVLACLDYHDRPAVLAEWIVLEEWILTPTELANLEIFFRGQLWPGAAPEAVDPVPLLVQFHDRLVRHVLSPMTQAAVPAIQYSLEWQRSAYQHRITRLAEQVA